MRFVAFGALLAIFTAGTVSPANAITNGTPDGVAHPSVGALIANKPYPDGTWAYCTGTLVSPTVLVTAAHCAKRGQKTARVSFAPHYRPGEPLYAGRFASDPRYRRASDMYDIAVVVFSSPVPGIRPARLPEAGLLSRLEAKGLLEKVRFTPVGYGSQTEGGGARKPRFVYTDTRHRATISYEDLSRAWLKLTAVRSRGDGGTCYGDSGGPNFLGDTDLLVATTVSGDDEACRSTNFDYRLDTPRARGFLSRYLTLPEPGAARPV